MIEKLKFVLVCYEGLPEKEIDFVRKILKDFKKYKIKVYKKIIPTHFLFDWTHSIYKKNT